jgi:hypothetical protein
MAKLRGPTPSASDDVSSMVQREQVGAQAFSPIQFHADVYVDEQSELDQ